MIRVFSGEYKRSEEVSSCVDRKLARALLERPDARALLLQPIAGVHAAPVIRGDWGERQHLCKTYNDAKVLLSLERQEGQLVHKWIGGALKERSEWTQLGQQEKVVRIVKTLFEEVYEELGIILDPATFAHSVVSILTKQNEGSVSVIFVLHLQHNSYTAGDFQRIDAWRKQHLQGSGWRSFFELSGVALLPLKTISAPEQESRDFFHGYVRCMAQQVYSAVTSGAGLTLAAALDPKMAPPRCWSAA